jgi:hypothetical protein
MVLDTSHFIHQLFDKLRWEILHGIKVGCMRSIGLIKRYSMHINLVVSTHLPFKVFKLDLQTLAKRAISSSLSSLKRSHRFIQNRALPVACSS